MVTKSAGTNRQLTSCLNGKITVGHRSAIIANHYFPLSKALSFTFNPREFRLTNTQLVFRDLYNLHHVLNESRRNPKVFRLAFESYLYKSQQLTETMRSEYKKRTGQKWLAKNFIGWNVYTTALKKARNAATHGCPIVLEEAQLSIYPNIEFASDNMELNSNKSYRAMRGRSFVGDPFSEVFPLQTVGQPRKVKFNDDHHDSRNYVLPLKEFAYYELRWDLLELGILSGLPKNVDALILVLKSFPTFVKYMEFYQGELTKNEYDTYKQDYWVKSPEKGGWVLNPKYHHAKT